MDSDSINKTDNDDDLDTTPYLNLAISNTKSQDDDDSLNYINYLNLVGYIINFIVTFTAPPIFGFPNMADVNLKYQTIITPADITFLIWIIIFISQGVFAVRQMWKGHRSNSLVQEGVSYWYFVVCMLQSVYSFAFCNEVMWLSVTALFGVLVSLGNIVIRQEFIDSEKSVRIQEFWMYKFPFSVHCGWTFATFAIHINVLIVASGDQKEEIWAYYTLIYAILVSIFALVYLSPPDFTIPSVLIWMTMGIALELNNPKEVIAAEFSEEELARLRKMVILLCVGLFVVTGGYGVFRVLTKEGREKREAAELAAELAEAIELAQSETEDYDPEDGASVTSEEEAGYYPDSVLNRILSPGRILMRYIKEKTGAAEPGQQEANSKYTPASLPPLKAPIRSASPASLSPLKAPIRSDYSSQAEYTKALMAVAAQIEATNSMSKADYTAELLAVSASDKPIQADKYSVQTGHTNALV